MITLPLSSLVPLRRTSAWGSFAVDQPLPVVYGRCRVTPVPADREGKTFCLADHGIDAVEAVTRDNAAETAYRLEHKQDATGKVVAWLILNQALKPNEVLAAVIRGKRHSKTGELIINPATILWDFLSSVCGLAVTEGDVSAFKSACATQGLELAGVIDDGRATIRTTIDNIMQSAGAVWSGSMPGIATLYPHVGARHASPLQQYLFDKTNMTTVSATTSADALATELRFSYACDWHTGETTRAVIVAAQAAAQRFGTTSTDYRADWITAPRQALALATRILQHKARPVWQIAFTAGLECRHLLPGDFVSINHPLVPVVGTCMLLSVETDIFKGEVQLQAELYAGNLPDITLAATAFAWEPVSVDGVTIAYQNGVAIFTILDEQNKPLAGANVTLDGDVTHVTDKAGKVQFAAARGKHNLTIEATGYQPFDMEVTV